MKNKKELTEEPKRKLKNKIIEDYLNVCDSHTNRVRVKINWQTRQVWVSIICVEEEESLLNGIYDLSDGKDILGKWRELDY